jgi:hypothetical protein
MKCSTCQKDYSPDCDYNQGRCPNHPPVLTISLWRAIIYIIIAPFIISAWAIAHPHKVWQQAKKEWNIK